ALAHCLEAYCGAFYHPLADGIAAEGVRLVKENLARAVRDGGDLDARAHMMAAAAMGATAFQKGLGAIHALSHPVGALYDTHHGLTNGVFMPYVLIFNRQVIEDRVKRLAAYIGLRPTFRAFLDWVLALRADIGVPHTLVGLKVDDANIDRIVAMAVEDPTAGGNPRQFDKRAARTIFRRALGGGCSFVEKIVQTGSSQSGRRICCSDIRWCKTQAEEFLYLRVILKTAWLAWRHRFLDRLA